ncbi:MAG: polysaccharide deacetylase family protein [Verrucomicrobiales bacterium]
MKAFFVLLLSSALLWGQAETPATAVPSESPETTESPQPPQPKQVTLEDDGTRVSVLGYHVFSSSEPATQMRIPTEKFREQMQRVKDSGIPVITLDQFLKWRRGEAPLPPKAILITMDDGWKSVYTEAYPIMKELQLPFTIYLYMNYVDGGGRALTTAMIKEMMKSGLCTIGCHSTSHPFPATVKRHAKAGPEAYGDFLSREMADSKKFLEEKFGQKVTTYAYPGGYHTPEMHLLADELGYDHLFTVIPGKVSRDSPIHTLNRYIVLGNHDAAFEAALTFRNGALAGGSATLAAPPTTPHPVQPAPGALVESRLPKISADLSEVADLDPESLEMLVGGFGKVPAKYNAEKKSFSWKINRPLRQPATQVKVTWKDTKGKAAEKDLEWFFRLDYSAAYLPK